MMNKDVIYGAALARWGFDAQALVRQFKKIEGLELVSCSPSEFGEVTE